MELKYQISGSDRKRLVGAISTALNQPIHYNGAPTFSYQVGDYTIDKLGTVTGLDNLDLEDALHQADFDADGDSRRYDAVGEDETPGVSEGDGVFYDSTEDYYNAGFRNAEHPTIQTFKDLEIADGNVEDDTLAIEIPMDGMTDAALENLAKLIASKKQLIKAAIGHDPETALALYPTGDGKLRFEWFNYTTDPDEVTAYATLVSLMCKTAREKKRISAKAQEEVTNPKFTFRVWLLSLGMIGDDYKTTRRVLLRNLSGNSAFAGGKMPTYTVNCYTLENGNEKDPMICESFDFHSYAKAKAKADEFLADCESLYFAGCHVENEAGDYLYEITMDGTVTEK